MKKSQKTIISLVLAVACAIFGSYFMYPSIYGTPALPRDFSIALRSASSITLYSLQPYGGPDLKPWDYHGHHLLGHIELKNENATNAKDALNAALKSGNSYWSSNCFFVPRHALRFVADGHTFDVVICYHCGQLDLFRDGERVGFYGKIGNTSAALDALLSAAHIPLADTEAAKNEGYAEEARLAQHLAEQGNADAQKIIGEMYLKGRGVKQNVPEAVSWLEKSLKDRSAADIAEFKFDMGEMYSDGRFVEKNYAEAVKWWQGIRGEFSAEVQERIGEMYDEGGFGIKKDPAEAAKWLRLAAEQGKLGGQLLLGWKYFYGDGVKQDYVEAYKWMILGNLGDDKRFPEKMTIEQMTISKRMADEWKKTHPVNPAEIRHHGYISIF